MSKKGGGKPRDNRAAIGKGLFEPIPIVAGMCRTVILMLTSPEDQVVLTAIGSLDKFAVKSLEDNLPILRDNGIMPALMPLILHPNKCVMRFALKLIAEMIILDDIKESLLNHQQLSAFLNIYSTNTDVFMQEFASLGLIEMTKDIKAIDILLEYDIIPSIFKRLGSPDFDVQKNSVELLNNMLVDSRACDVIRSTKGINYANLVKFLGSPYPVIQRLAIEAFHKLISRTRDLQMQAMLRDSKAMDVFFKMVEDPTLPDLCIPVLKLIGCACEDLMTAELVLKSGSTLRLLKVYDERKGLERLAALDSMILLSRLHDAWQQLYEAGFCERLLGSINDKLGYGGGGVLWAAACEGISNVCAHGPTLTELEGKNPLPVLFDIMCNEGITWDSRTKAMVAIHSLLYHSQRVLLRTIPKISGQIKIFKFINTPPTVVPPESLIVLLSMLRLLSMDLETREAILSVELVNTLLYAMEPMGIARLPVQLTACDTLCSFLGDDGFKKMLYRAGCTEILMKCLTSDHSPLRVAAAGIIQVCASYKKLNSIFIRDSFLDRLLENKIMRRAFPIWETAIESIFNNHLPAKFAYTGRLELRDITTNPFYAVKKLWAPFPVIEVIINEMVSPRLLVILVGFNPEEADPDESEITLIEPDENLSNVEEESVQNETDGTETSEFIYCKPDDPYLQCYLDNMRRVYKALNLVEGATEDTLEEGNIYTSTVAERVQVLARFVHHQMCGPEPGDQCGNHIMELHMNELKWELMTNAIPIGYIRVGGFLERSVLFKVLADRLGIPCALQRGRQGRAWIEVAIPETNMDSPGPFRLPTRLLRPSHIVNLMDQPGKLMQLLTVEAQRYQGLDSLDLL